MNAAAYRLLVRCAHLPGNAAADQTLAETIAGFQDWDALLPLAERHSLGPLFYAHIQQLGFVLPPPVRLQFQGLFLRHKRANEIRLARLAEILAVLEAQQIPVIVLKGGALAPQIYPAPGLRPMSDLDILVPPEQVFIVQTILRDLGFTASLPNDPTPSDHRHLPVIMQPTAEMAVSVEIHRALGGTPRFPEGKPFDVLWKTAVSYPFATQTAHMLGYEDMLWHLHTHMVSEHTRLIRIVDSVAFAETFAQEIDWQLVQQQTPQVMAALSVLHFVMPLSDELRQTAGIATGPQPDGVDVMLQDWPPLPRHLWGGKSRREIWQETFSPTEASLRLYYGIPVDRPITSYRWARHPAQIVAWYVQRRAA
jgi:hypothetical protein